MTNVVNFTKKAFTWSVVVMTILWSVGISALVPTAAHAETVVLEPGDIYRVEGNADVYILDADMNARYFPNSEVFHTWYADFSGLNVITPEQSGAYELAAIPGVNFRPGSRLVKITTNPRVYAVGAENARHWVNSPETAAAAYGAAWASLVRDVSVFHWANYQAGADLDGLSDGQLVRVAGAANAAAEGVYYIWGGERHMVDGDLPAFLARDVRDLSEATVNAVPSSGSSVTPAAIVANPTQGSAVVSPGNPSTPVDPGTPASGDLTLRLSASTPAAMLVPQAASHVKFFSFEAQAGAEAAMLDEIELERIGLGSNQDFLKVWLEVNGAAVSNAQSVNSDNTVTLRPQYSLSAGQKVTFDLVADLAGAANQTARQDGFRIASAAMVDANGASVNGSFPISGQLMSYSAYSVGSVTISDSGAASDVEVGSEQAIIGEFKLDFASNNERDGVFESVRFKLKGSGNMSDLDNLNLVERGEVVAEGVVWGDYVTFMLMDGKDVLEDGKSRSFEVRADLVSGENAETIVLVLDDNRDLRVSEVDGFGASVTEQLDGADATATESMKLYTIDAGQFTVSLDPSNPSAESYAPGAEDVTVLVAKLDLGQPITVDGLKVYLDAATTASSTGHAAVATQVDSDIERVELYKNGVRIGSSVTSITAGTAVTNDGVVEDTEFYYNFNSSMELDDNDILSVVVDFEDSPMVGHAYAFEFSSSNFDDPEYRRDGRDVPSAKKSGAATGKLATLTAASVSVTRNDGYPSGESFVGGVQKAKLFQFVIDAGSASDVLVRSLAFAASVNGSGAYFQSGQGNYSKFTNCFLSQDGGVTALANQTEDMSAGTASGTLSFSSLNLPIAKSGQAQLGLYCDIQAGITAATGLVFRLDSSLEVIEDNDGDEISYSTDVYSQDLSIVSTGSLTVGVSGGTADPEIVVADASNASGVGLGSWVFDADNDNIEVTKLWFSNVTSTFYATSTAADARVAGYDLVVNGEVLQSKVPSSGNVVFDIDSKRIQIEKDRQVNVSVRVRLNEISQASQTGAEFNLVLTGVKALSKSSGSTLTTIATSTANTEIAADSIGSAETGPRANTIVAYKAVPQLATVAFTPERLSNGPREIYKFSVKAISGDVSWAHVTLNVGGACQTAAVEEAESCISSLSIKDGAGTVIPSTITTTTGKVLISLTNPKTVQASESEVYTVVATLAGFIEDQGNSLSVQIKDNSTVHQEPQTSANAILDADGGATEGSFVWSDNSGSYGSTSAIHWMTGTDVDGLDTAFQNHSF